MRVLISGIGRSATTLLYQQVAKCMLLNYDNIRFSYEPYLWSLNEPSVNGCSFGMDMLSHFGIHVHKSTPLLLPDSHPAHDKFVGRLFGNDAIPGEQSVPDAFLTKFIRGAGRLESFIKKFPDIKIVACLRNPIDTINSSLGMFSFLGEEFHTPDHKKLFYAASSFQDPYYRSISKEDFTQLDYSVLWWRLLTDATLDVAKRYPDNVHLFPLEQFKQDRESALNSLFAFLPILNSESFGIRASAPAGPKISTVHLLNSDLDTLAPQLDYYLENVVSKYLDLENRIRLTESIFKKIADAQYVEPIAGDSIGQSTPVKLRAQIIRGFDFSAKYSQQSNQFGKDDFEEPSIRLPFDSIISDHCQTNNLSPTLEKKFRPNFSDNESTKSFGCVITCHNNKTTILDSIVSALSQTRPFDQIVVVDDGSTDGSTELVKEFAGKYRTVEALVLKQNAGVSVARHLGICRLRTDYITQLDGDDCFWPSKNYHESAALLDDPNAIAFSDILIVNDNRRQTSSTQAYIGDSEMVARRILSRQPGVPRDMTFARDLYFEAGGYDFRFGLYEDLDFKFRLAKKTGANWKKSNAIAGTIYNRINPSASRNEGLRLPRALTNHFFRYVDHIGLSENEASDAYREIISPFPSEWTEQICDRLARSTRADIMQMKKTLLDRRITTLNDSAYSQTVFDLCNDPAFNSVPVLWSHKYGLADQEGPYAGFGKKHLHWQTSKSCGFSINSQCEASGVRGLLYLPHLPKQRLNITVEQLGTVVKQSFDLDGKQVDEGGNHVLQKVEIPIPIRPGEAKISCFASSHMEEQERERDLYCLFADWQLFA